MKIKMIKSTALFLSLIMLLSMIPVFATGDNYIGDNYNYNDNIYDDENFEPVSVGMDFSVEAKDEIQLKLELARELDDLVFEVEAMREKTSSIFILKTAVFRLCHMVLPYTEKTVTASGRTLIIHWHCKM